MVTLSMTLSDPLSRFIIPEVLYAAMSTQKRIHFTFPTRTKILIYYFFTNIQVKHVHI